MSIMTSTAPTANVIRNPFQRGQHVTIAAGTLVRTTHPAHRPSRVLARAQTVRIHTVSDGWVDLWNEHGMGIGYVVLPTLTWLCSGHYYADVKVTPEMCQAAGMPIPRLPDTTREAYRLDVIPAYGPGYDNRDPHERP